MNVEREIVRVAVNNLLLGGYTIAVRDGIDDGEICQRRTDRVDAIMRAIMSTDEDTLIVCKFNQLTDEWESFGYIYLIYGNDGWDVISDHTTNLEEVLKPAFQRASEIEAMYA
jgi:hypothetical protein